MEQDEQRLPTVLFAVVARIAKLAACIRDASYMQRPSYHQNYPRDRKKNGNTSSLVSDLISVVV